MALRRRPLLRMSDIGPSRRRDAWPRSSAAGGEAVSRVFSAKGQFLPQSGHETLCTISKLPLHGR
jgi:hypothetical protein